MIQGGMINHITSAISLFTSADSGSVLAPNPFVLHYRVKLVRTCRVSDRKIDGMMRPKWISEQTPDRSTKVAKLH
jgi:hypothetical protein